MSARTTATARALEAIGRLLAQPGRQALTRAEVRALGVADGACDRALRRLRTEGRIRRYGSGIYEVGGAKVFQAAPEALESLGCWIVSPERPENWFARPNGTLIRLDRPCRRAPLRHRFGVGLTRVTPAGPSARKARPEVSNRRRAGMAGRCRGAGGSPSASAPASNATPDSGRHNDERKHYGNRHQGDPVATLDRRTSWMQRSAGAEGNPRVTEGVGNG